LCRRHERTCDAVAGGKRWCARVLCTLVVYCSVPRTMRHATEYFRNSTSQVVFPSRGVHAVDGPTEDRRDQRVAGVERGADGSNLGNYLASCVLDWRAGRLIPRGRCALTRGSSPFVSAWPRSLRGACFPVFLDLSWKATPGRDQRDQEDGQSARWCPLGRTVERTR
jgi:hypothetical protein